MQYNTLKARIVADIYANGNEEITGSILQGDLLAMVNSLASAGAMYGGVITPASAAPADLNQATVYLALEAGTYTNFVDSNNDPIVTAGPALITYDGGASLVFSKTDLPAGGGGSNYVTITSSTTDVVIPGDQSDRDAINLLISYAYDNNGSTTYYLGILSFATSDLHDQAPLLQTLRTDSGGEIGSWLVGVISGSGEVFIQPNDINSGDVEVNIYDMDGVQLEVRQSGDADYPTASDFNDVELSDTTTLEQTADKVSTLSGNETSTTKYPNTKAVVDAIGKMGVISQTQTWTQAADGGYDYTINPASIVMGLVPNYFITMWELRGGSTAIFNENTGYFEYLDLTDISYEEAKVIYSQSIDTPSNEALTRSPARSILPFLSSSHFTAATTYAMMSNSMFESVFFGDLHGHDTTKTNSAAYFMYSMFYIKTVQGVLDFSALAADVSTFYACFSLVTIKIKGLKANMSFRNSSRLSAESVAYMITNAGTATITITLHATAYARATADAGVQAALAAKTNVSLASA